MISIRRTCSLFARAYPKATLLAPTPDARPACTRNYSGAEVQFGALDRLAARIASIEPKGSHFLTGWTLSIPALALPDDRLRLLQRDVRREHPGLAPRRGVAGTKGDGGGLDERHRLARAAARATWVIGVAAPVFGMSACLSANSLVYLCVGVLMVFGVRAYWQTDLTSILRMRATCQSARP